MGIYLYPKTLRNFFQTYSGCPGRDCQRVTLNEELRQDYLLLTRTPFGSMENDVNAACDCILTPVSSLAARSYGIHWNVVLVHASTLSEAVYKLRLSNKIADLDYTHCDKMPIHGSGQGSACSPKIYTFISSKLFQAHNDKAHKMWLHSSDGTISLKIMIIGLVDDSTVVTGGDQSKPIDFFVEKIQADAQLWRDLLFQSGGKLELPKYGFHTTYYDFNKESDLIMHHKPEQDIIIKNEHKEKTIIKKKNIYTPGRIWDTTNHLQDISKLRPRRQ